MVFVCGVCVWCLCVVPDILLNDLPGKPTLASTNLIKYLRQLVEHLEHCETKEDPTPSKRNILKAK